MMLFNIYVPDIVRAILLATIAAYAPGLFAQPVAMSFADSLVLPFVRIDTASIDPSYPILYPSAADPVRFLVIGDRLTAGRIADGWVRRTGGICETVLTRSRTELGIPDPESAGESVLLGHAYAEDRLNSLLASHWDAIWLSVDPSALPAAARTRIRSLVQSGSALITDGEMEQYSRMLGIDRSPSRLALPMAYAAIEQFNGVRAGDGILVSVPPMPVDCGERICGDYLNTVAAAVQATTGVPTSLTILRVEVPERPVEHEVIGIQRYRMRYRNESDADSLHIIARCRNSAGQVVSEVSHAVTVDRGEGIITLSYPMVPVGTYSLDITCLRFDAVLACAGATFSVDTEERIESVRFWEPHAPRGDYAIGTMTMTTQFREGMYVTTELVDQDGTVLVQRIPEVVPGRKSLDFILPLRASFPRSVTVIVSFYKNNECVERIARPYLITDPPPQWPYAFGIGSGSLYPGITTSELARLQKNGVTLLTGAADMTAEQSGYTTLLRNAATAGLGVVPDLTNVYRAQGFGEEDGRDAFTEYSDSLLSLDPAAYALNVEEVTDVALTQLSGVAVLSFPGADRVTGPIAVETDGSSHMGQGMIIPETWLNTTDRERLKAIPWWAAFSGYDHFWWPEGESVSSMAVTPDGRCAPAVAELGEAAQSVRRILGSHWGPTMPFTSGRSAADMLRNGNNEPVTGIAAWEYRDSLAVYLALAPDPAFDDMPVPERLFLTGWMDDARPYGYDLSSSSFLGIDDTRTVQFRNGVFIAVWLPYRVLRVNLTMKTTVYAPDDSLTFQVEVVPSQESPMIHHPFELTVRPEEDSGDGDTSRYRQIIAGDQGSYTGVVDLGMFGQGRWQLGIRDLVSGNEVSRRFIIRDEQEWNRE